MNGWERFKVRSVRNGLQGSQGVPSSQGERPPLLPPSPLPVLFGMPPPVTLELHIT